MKTLKYIRLGIASLIIVVALLACLFTPVLAVANPDSIDLITTRVFENIFETDDMLFVVSYDVAYASEPTEPADETFLLALYDTDGTTLLFSRALNYYQYNIHSIYLDAETAASLTWGEEYNVRIMGNPIYFTPAEDVTMDTTTLSPSTHWIEGDMADSRELLQYHCLDLAADLEDAWTIQLVITTADGQVLNSVGRTVFLDAIPGLDSALTELFQVSVSYLDYEQGSYNGTYENETSIASKLGTQIATSFENIGTLFGMSGQTAAMLWIAFVAVSIAAVVFLTTGNTTASLILTVPIIIMGSLLGAVPLALLYVLAAFIVVYLAYHIWLKGM